MNLMGLGFCRGLVGFRGLGYGAMGLGGAGGLVDFGFRGFGIWVQVWGLGLNPLPSPRTGLA